MSDSKKSESKSEKQSAVKMVALMTFTGLLTNSARTPDRVQKGAEFEADPERASHLEIIGVAQKA